MILLLFAMPVFGAANSAGDSLISDQIVFGDEASENGHSLKAEGKVRTVLLNTQLGILKSSKQTREIAGKGSGISFEMSAPKVKSPLSPRILLEIQEIHERRPQVFGYTVLAGGKEVYFRTYEEVGAGPNHYFIEIDRALIGADGKLKIGIRSDSGAPFNISQAWLYPDFDGLAADEKVFRNLRFVVGASYELAGLKPPPKKKDEEPDIGFKMEVAKKLVELYGSCRDYDFGLFSSVAYSRRSREECRGVLDRALRLSEATGVPVAVMFSSWWGCSNVGADGLGGYFSDLKYENIGYDKESGKYRPSFPTQWGGAIWPTKNNKHLNLCNNYNIGILARHLADSSAAIQAENGKLPLVQIVAEMGPSIADYNAATIEDARKDGVSLDPADGLSPEEGRWILKNYGRYFAQEVPSYRAALGHGDVIVRQGRISYPSDPPLDNIYTHGYWGDHSPPNDPKYAYWQANLNDGMWCSGELTEAYPQTWYDYALANGRIACVNLERSMIQSLRYMKFAYGNGLDFVTLFNAKTGDEKLLHEADGISGEKKETLHYDRRILDVNLGRDMKLAGNPALIRCSDIVDGSPFHAVESGKPGVVVFKVSDAETSFGKGLVLEIHGSAGRAGGKNKAHIRVMTGSAVEQMREIRTLDSKDFNPGYGWGASSFARIDLGEQARGKTDILIGLELFTDGYPQDVSVSKVYAFVPWGRKTGQADNSLPTFRESRTRSLWLQQRVRLERLMRDYNAKGGEDADYGMAQTMYRQGRYVSAYKMLAANIAELLPARYTVQGNGKLGRYPVEIQCVPKDGIVQVELFAIGNENCEFRIQAPRESSCRMTVSGLDDSRKYVLNPKAGNIYSLQVADGGAKDSIQPKKGKVEFEVAVKPPVEPAPFPFTPVETVQFPRKSKGRFESETGVIKSFKAPSITGEFCNGIIELDSGSKYELAYTPWWTKASLVGLEGLKSVSLEKIAQAFQVGSSVTIETEPQTFKGFIPRAYSVSQPVKLLLNENYVNPDDNWSKRAMDVKGLVLQDFRGKKLWPAKYMEPGHIIYHINSEYPLSQTAVGFTGRLIIRPENRVTIFVRSGTGEWKKCGEYVTSSPGSNNFDALKIIDITEQVRGKREFDLKVEMVTTNSTWCSLGSLQVRTLDIKASAKTQANGTSAE